MRSQGGCDDDAGETGLLENQYQGEKEETRNGSSSSQRSEIVYTDSERAELLRRLDSIKDHLLRGVGGGGNGVGVNIVDTQNQNQNQPLLKPIHVHAPGHGHGHGLGSYYHPYPTYGRPPPIPYYPNLMVSRYGQYVEIGSDIIEPHSFFPATPSRYNDMLTPYSPVSSSYTPSRYNDMLTPYSPVSSSSHHQYKCNNSSSSIPTSLSSPGPSRGGGGYARWPSDVDSEMGNGAFARGYVKKAVSVSDSDGFRRCHPLAGGAPFIACHSCFELLQLPKKKLLAQEDDETRLYKLQCGSCSQVIRFKIVDKKLVFDETKPVSLQVVDDRNSVVAAAQERSIVEEEPEESKCSDDVEERSNISSEERVRKDVNNRVRSKSQCSEDSEERSRRSSVSNEQQGKKHVKSVRRRHHRSEVPEQQPATTASDSASLLELFEYSNVNRAALAYGMAQLGYSKEESFAKKQDSLKPESIAATTETEFSSYNGYSNTEISEDSRYSNGKEDNTERITTRSSTERNEEDHDKSLEVWVNGHLIPESLVSSAEKLAGPIQAGKYWYDYRAGFWGVMGKPCLGIIPPFIEEFSHPMPDNCAMGNTQVFVNGRELNKRDFELLVGRGLPQDKNRSYIVDISGRILDGDSGEELKSLGKLAPTVEKVKHGFGMRVPRSLAS